MNYLSQKILAILFIISMFSVSGYLSRKPIPFELDLLLDHDSRERKEYLAHKNLFSEEHQLLAALHYPNSSTTNKLELAKKFEQLLLKVKGVKSVSSINNAEFIKVSGRYVRLTPFIQEGELTAEGQRALADPFYSNRFLSKDGDSLLLGITLSSSITGQGEKEALNEIFAISSLIETAGVRVHLLGPKVAKSHYLKEMIMNQKVISPLILLILCAITYFLFRSFIVLFWTLVTISLSYAMVGIVIFTLEGGLNPYSSMALIFVLIISTSDLVHYFSIFVRSPEQLPGRIEHTHKKVFWPCLLTTVSTAVGFISLLLNDMAPVRNFGIYCSFGSVAAFLLTFYFIPLCLRAFLSESKQLPSIVYEFDGTRFFAWLNRSSVLIVSSFILLGSVLLYGSLKLEIDDDLYDKFVGSHPLSQASQFYRKHFGFVSSVDLVYPLTEFPPSKEQLGKIAKLENKVRELELVSDISSFLKYEDFLGRLYDKDDSERARSLTYLLDDYGVFNGLYGEQASVLRSTVLINSSSSKELEATLGKIRTLIKPSSGVRLQGFVVMRTFLYNKIVENFLVSFAISFVVIFFIFVLLFRKFSWALVAMIPNLLPLILIFGMMGFLDIKMEGSLVMLVCVTIGIAVDDTIHFMYAIKSRLAESVPIELAIKQAFHQTSKALVGTTLIFVMSFPCLLLSELKLSMQMGVFIMFSLLMALLADFVLLPVLLLRFSRTQKNTHTP